MADSRSMINQYHDADGRSRCIVWSDGVIETFDDAGLRMTHTNRFRTYVYRKDGTVLMAFYPDGSTRWTSQDGRHETCYIGSREDGDS